MLVSHKNLLSCHSQCSASYQGETVMGYNSIPIIAGSGLTGRQVAALWIAPTLVGKEVLPGY